MNRDLEPEAGEAGNIDRLQGEDPGDVPSLEATVHSVEYNYSGPLPPPEILKRFDEILPGSAQKIFNQFEMQAAHRRQMEAAVIASGTFSQRVGSISGFVLGIMGVGGGVWLTHEGRNLGGFSTVLVTLASLVSIYVSQRRKQSAERAAKRGSAPVARK